MEPFEIHPGVEPDRTTRSLAWRGLTIDEYFSEPDGEVFLPDLSHHLIVLTLSAGAGFAVSTGGAATVWRPTPGAATILPAGRAIAFRWDGRPDTALFSLHPALIDGAAAEIGLDPTKVEIAPALDVRHPQLQPILAALREELASSGPGSRLCAEALGTVLAVRLIRHFVARLPAGRSTGRLDGQSLRSVIEYVESGLDGPLSLAALAAVAGLSIPHFARQFKGSTGSSPHQYVIDRRVERAKRLLRDGRLSLAEIAVACGFSDQSHLTRHFRRVTGITPRRFE